VDVFHGESTGKEAGTVQVGVLVVLNIATVVRRYWLPPCLEHRLDSGRRVFGDVPVVVAIVGRLHPA
jgi:hypothetical protein